MIGDDMKQTIHGLALSQYYSLGMQLGLKPSQVNKAYMLFDEVRENSFWSNRRTDKCLLIDCIFLMARNLRDTKVRIKDVEIATMRIFGEKTKPNPNKWVSSVPHLIDDAFQ